MATSNNNNSKELRTSVIGLDLGSSLTKIAAVQKGVVDIITNEANLRQTPTIVGYGNNERLIGESGNVKLQSNLNNSIIAPQRYIGLKHQQYLKQEGRLAPNQLRHQDQQSFFKVNCQGHQTRISPEQATAAFLTKIQQIVQLNNINNQYLAVSIPNYLTHKEKVALLDSLSILKRSAKHQFGFQLVNQSTAVGLEYGFYKKAQFSQKQEDAKNIMFVDFGHSKLSLYVIRFTRNYQKVVYQKHLRQFGCKNMDKIMFDFYTQIFEKNNPNLQISVRQSKKATLKLMQNIEKQRKILSGNSEYDFNIECLLEDSDLSYTMRREQFEQIMSPFINELKLFFNEASQSMREKGINISGIELIGGGSRIPIFIKSLWEVFGTEPSRTLNSNQCIARGAGLFSAMNSGLFRINPYYSVEQSPETIICSWRGEEEQMQNESNQLILLQQNEAIYSKKAVEFVLPQGTPNNLLFSLSSNNQLSNDRPICQFKLSLPQGQAKVKLTFQFDSNNLLKNIVAFSVGEKQTPLSLQEFKLYENLPQHKIEQFSRIQREQGLKDTQILRYYERKNSFESQLYQLKQKIGSSLANRQTKQFISPQTYNNMMNYFQSIEDKLTQIPNFEEQLKQIHNALKQFYKNVEQIKKKHSSFQAELNKFINFINQVGNSRTCRQYANEEIEEAKKWIEQIQSEQRNRNKYQQPVATPQEISSKMEALKSIITKLEEQERYARSQRPNTAFFQPRNSQYRQSHPFNTNYQPHPARNQGRNSSFSGYNPGFFSGFPSFF